MMHNLVGAIPGAEHGLGNSLNSEIVELIVQKRMACHGREDFWKPGEQALQTRAQSAAKDERRGCSDLQP